jgi:hypothetical protein
MDDRPIARRAPTLPPKRRILIVCEGRETERGYFQKFQHAVRNGRVHVEIARETGVPLTVVKVAARLKDGADEVARLDHDENHRWDEVWGVFDVDEHPNLHEARQLAITNSIELAVSNPCFELWALLHFQDQRAHIERDRIRGSLQRHLANYGKSLDFAKMNPGYADALRRAQQLDQEADRHGQPGRNPTTNVYRLTESIRNG